MGKTRLHDQAPISIVFSFGRARSSSDHIRPNVFQRRGALLSFPAGRTYWPSSSHSGGWLIVFLSVRCEDRKRNDHASMVARAALQICENGTRNTQATR